MDAPHIERLLTERQMPHLLPGAEGWVLPHYEGLSIANLPATIAALLSTNLPGALPALPEEIWSEWLPGLRRVGLVPRKATRARAHRAALRGVVPERYREFYGLVGEHAGTVCREEAPECKRCKLRRTCKSKGRW